MEGEKFTNTSMSIKALLGLIEANDIAIPEIQRPFVWKKSQVRALGIPFPILVHGDIEEDYDYDESRRYYRGIVYIGK